MVVILMTNKHFYDQTLSTSMSEYVLFAYSWKHFKNGYFEMGLILINFVMQMHKTKHVKIDLILNISTIILEYKSRFRCIMKSNDIHRT